MDEPGEFESTDEAKCHWECIQNARKIDKEATETKFAGGEPN